MLRPSCSHLRYYIPKFCTCWFFMTLISFKTSLNILLPETGQGCTFSVWFSSDNGSKSRRSSGSTLQQSLLPCTTVNFLSFANFEIKMFHWWSYMCNDITRLFCNSDEDQMASESLRRALREYGLKFSVILNDPDLANFRGSIEFKKLQEEVCLCDCCSSAFLL